MFLKLYFMTDKIQIVKIFIEKKLKYNKSESGFVMGQMGHRDNVNQDFSGQTRKIYTTKLENQREKEMKK